MIVKQEMTIDNVVFVYQKSDSNFYIEGGEPKGLYVDALDPKELKRKYVETNIPIPPEELNKG